ncbi:MAG: response regulator [Candidatus Caenarcaniphilales bacterium]|jgi:two-component system response regulator|nr:response regulator [Candidatus Caenarcaniphilales bacterium]
MGTKIIFADDSREDFELIKLAFDEIGHKDEILWLKDGQEILDFFRARAHFASNENIEGRYLMIMDLNMPKLNGLEALAMLKSCDELRKIPIIMMTTSQSQLDLDKAYNAGANSFMLKSYDFSSLVEICQSIKNYWIDKALIPTVRIIGG